MPDQSGENELLCTSQERARGLCEALRRQEAELGADTLLDPAVREAGLKAVRCAADSAAKLLALVEQAMSPGNIVAAEHELTNLPTEALPDE